MTVPYIVAMEMLKRLSGNILSVFTKSLVLLFVLAIMAVEWVRQKVVRRIRHDPMQRE